MDYFCFFYLLFLPHFVSLFYFIWQCANKPAMVLVMDNLPIFRTKLPWSLKLCHLVNSINFGNRDEKIWKSFFINGIKSRIPENTWAGRLPITKWNHRSCEIYRWQIRWFVGMIHRCSDEQMRSDYILLKLYVRTWNSNEVKNRVDGVKKISQPAIY